jgi:lysophospholipase L1-like esterase
VQAWNRFAALGVGMLLAYLLVVFLLGTKLLGLNIRTWHVGLLTVCGMAGAYWVLGRALRQGAISASWLKGIAVGSIVTFFSLIAADTAFSLYLGNYTPLGLYRYFFQPAYRVTDRQLWFGELLPPRYYPTKKHFQLHKPGVVLKGSVYGWFYYPELMKSPTIAKSVLQRRSVLYSIDENGFRETTPIEKARVFALGDSYVFGTGVSQDQTWPEQLERITGKAIYNLGVNGTSPKQQLMLLEYLLNTKSDSLKIRHLLWMIFEGNDLEDSYSTYNHIAVKRINRNIFKTISDAAGSIASAIRDQSVLHRLLAGQIAIRSPRAGFHESSHYSVDGVKLTRELYHSDPYGYRLFLPGYIKRMQEPESYVRDHPNRPLLDETFRDMASLAKKFGFDVTILIAPTAARLYAPYFEDFPTLSGPHFMDYVEQLAKRYGFNTLNLYRLMQPYAEKELLYWRDDAHWNQRGNEVVAELVARRAHF